MQILLARAVYLTLCLVTAKTSMSFAQARTQEFKAGRWVGKLTTEGSTKSVGVLLDVFLAQPNDVREFPRLEALLRLSLGGPLGHEREVAHFAGVNYDFSTGMLTFDESSSDLVMQAEVVDSGKILGKVMSSQGGAKGALELVYADRISSGGDGEPCDPDEPCAPPDDPNQRIPIAGFLPSLAGTYTGSCGSQQARLEIASGRMPMADSNSPDLLKYSSIQARLGLAYLGQCTETFCVAKAWESGQFEFFKSRLILEAADSIDSCAYNAGGGLDCKILFGKKEQACSFQPENPIFNQLKVTNIDYSLPVEGSEREPLPPSGADLGPLKALLDGAFFGYVWHESTGRFQLLQFTSLATSSTENPHNESDIYISGALQFHLGSDFQSSFIGFKVDRRTFFPSQGMTLRSASSDVFLVVDAWSKGYLKGKVYSETYGRIGPFELHRSNSPLTFPDGAKRQGSPSGIFFGKSPATGNPWNFDLKIASVRQDSLLSVNGTAQIAAPGLPFPRFKIDKAGYDLFSDRISLLVVDGTQSQRLVTGSLAAGDNLWLWIPASSIWGAKLPAPMSLRYERQKP